MVPNQPGHLNCNLKARDGGGLAFSFANDLFECIFA